MEVALPGDMPNNRILITIALTLSACGGEATDLASNSAAVTVTSNVYDEALAYGLTYAADPSLGGFIIADTIRTVMCPCYSCATSPAPIALQDRVVRDSTSGTLDFYTRVVSVPPGFYLDAFARSGFYSAVPHLDFNWRPDGVGSIPSLGGAASLVWSHHNSNGWFAPAYSGEDGPFWADIEPNATGPVMTSGQQSRFIFLRTPATDFDESGQLSVSRFGDGYGCSIVPAYAPK
jgi:hypothetical protein